jgi:ribosomal protein S16
MIKIKLSPRGKKHQITYRIVIAEARSKFDGKIIDDLGFYTPQTKTLSLNKEKLADWQKKGAQLTLGVDKLLNPDKYPKKIKIKKEEKPKDIKEKKVPENETEVKNVSTEESNNSEPIESNQTEAVSENETKIE